MSNNSLQAAPLYSLRHQLFTCHLSALKFPITDSQPHTPPFHFAYSRRLRRPSPAVMSSGDALRPPFQLDDESDFERILSSDGLLSVCGFGSLLSERSARSTFPDLIGFRVARLNCFRRVFAHVAPIFFERGIANPETKEISSLSVEPCEGETLIVTVFSIKKSEIPSFIEREHEFRFLAVLPETLDEMPFTSAAVLCARFSDEEYLQIRCKAKNLGDAAYDNFLDHTFLGDRKTTIHEYLATTGSGIMEEEPPEPLKTRYGG